MKMFRKADFKFISLNELVGDVADLSLSSTEWTRVIIGRLNVGQYTIIAYEVEFNKVLFNQWDKKMGATVKTKSGENGVEIYMLDKIPGTLCCNYTVQIRRSTRALRDKPYEPPPETIEDMIANGKLPS